MEDARDNEVITCVIGRKQIITPEMWTKMKFTISQFSSISFFFVTQHVFLNPSNILKYKNNNSFLPFLKILGKNLNYTKIEIVKSKIGNYGFILQHHAKIIEKFFNKINMHIHLKDLKLANIWKTHENNQIIAK